MTIIRRDDTAFVQTIDRPMVARAKSLIAGGSRAFGAAGYDLECQLYSEFFPRVGTRHMRERVEVAVTHAYHEVLKESKMPDDYIVPGVSLSRLMRAIAHVETSGGVNNWPRIEAAFLPKGATFTVQGRIITGTGRAFTATAAQRWNRLPEEHRLGSAASWSPWQILYHTAVEQGYNDLPFKLHDPLVAERVVKKRLTALALKGATTVEQFADAWNSGSFRDSIVPAKYIADVLAAYQEAH